MLLTGDGDAFSAGLNLKEVASLDAPGMERFLATLEKMVTTLFEYPGPTIAWVNGHAIAGGCVLALCCDHRVACQRGAHDGPSAGRVMITFPPSPTSSQFVAQIVKSQLLTPQPIMAELAQLWF